MNKPFDIVIPAASGGFPGMVRELRVGKIITVLSASGAFFVSKNNGPRLDLNAGRVSGSEDAPEFSVLMFYNTSGVVINARVLVSDTPYTGEIAATINTTLTVSGKNAPTYPKGTTGTVNGGAAFFSGIDGGGQLRKSFTIFNKETAASGLVLVVYAANGVEMHRIDGRQGYTPGDCGGAFSIFGEDAGGAAANVRYSCGEVFYV